MLLGISQEWIRIYFPELFATNCQLRVILMAELYWWIAHLPVLFSANSNWLEPPYFCWQVPLLCVTSDWIRLGTTGPYTQLKRYTWYCHEKWNKNIIRTRGHFKMIAYASEWQSTLLSKQCEGKLETVSRSPSHLDTEEREPLSTGSKVLYPPGRSLVQIQWVLWSHCPVSQQNILDILYSSQGAQDSAWCKAREQLLLTANQLFWNCSISQGKICLAKINL